MCFEYIDSLDKYDETSLPPKENYLPNLKIKE